MADPLYAVYDPTAGNALRSVGSVVASPLPAPLASVAVDPSCVDADGQLLPNAAWTPTATPPAFVLGAPPVSWKISTIAFYRRMSTHNHVALELAALQATQTGATLQMFKTRVNAVTTGVDLASPEISQARPLLGSLGFTTADLAALFDVPCQPGEAP